MEDMFVTSVAEVSGHIIACFGVFDGKFLLTASFLKYG